jgi:hypothetical protein
VLSDVAAFHGAGPWYTTTGMMAGKSLAPGLRSRQRFQTARARSSILSGIHGSIVLWCSKSSQTSASRPPSSLA